MKLPNPPIHKMRTGQVWQVSVWHKLRESERGFGEPNTEMLEYLTMIIDPQPLGWRIGKWHWQCSRLYIGNMKYRKLQHIWDDLNKLRLQDPPYFKNYTVNLLKYRGCHIFWDKIIEWPQEA